MVLAPRVRRRRTRLKTWAWAKKLPMKEGKWFKVDTRACAHHCQYSFFNRHEGYSTCCFFYRSQLPAANWQLPILLMKTVIIIVGATAVGKTSWAIKLAQHFQTEIISADSRQCFKELNIGVARPSEKELKMVKHHFIASHSIHENVSAGIFARYALEKTKELFQRHDVVILTGGTGLYIKAFCDGMDEIPEVPADIRKQLVTQYEQNGMEWLQRQ